MFSMTGFCFDSGRRDDAAFAAFCALAAFAAALRSRARRCSSRARYRRRIVGIINMNIARGTPAVTSITVRSR